MNANLENPEQSYFKELSELTEQLRQQIADKSLVDYIHSAILSLISGNGSVEADIRRIIQEEHNAGNLRDETFELVQRILDRLVTEDVLTARDGTKSDVQVEDPFASTAVIDPVARDAESADDRLQAGSVLRDRFLLQERIGGGGMGVVYKALDRRLAEADCADSWVAIKVLAPKFARDGHALRAFQQEAAKGRWLSHPNIVRFIDLDRDDDLYFIVMEWLDGKSLANILDDNKSKGIDKQTALDIVKQVGSALDHAHRRGVVHADVKPGNIIVSADGEVKLFDFGVARVRQELFNARAKFDPGVLGAVTPAYSSMQVLTGEEPVVSDDVFSLGCLMYRLVAGYRVFGPRNAAEAADEGMEPQRPEGLLDAEWHALRKALSNSRVSRFDSAMKFIEALEAPAPRKAPIIVPDRKKPDGDKRRLWPYLLTVAVLAAGAAWLYHFGLPDGLKDGLPDISLPRLPVEGDESTSIEPSVQVAPKAAEEFAAEDDAASVIDDQTPVAEAPRGDVRVEEPAEETGLPDYSTLTPTTIEISLARAGEARTEVDLVLREDGEPAVLELVRRSKINDGLVVRLEEVGYSGNRSPWESGQYEISDDSMVQFLPGQERARITLSMRPDAVRESDRQVSLLVRDIENSQSEFARINLSLEDDDQRRFESGLVSNSIAFAVDQAFVWERDPAVQIDVLRFNPDQSALTVEYDLHEVTAVEGEDYFAPGSMNIRFGPGQRTARILIPIVQDADPESDEAFIIELPDPQTNSTSANIFRRIAVMIRDDD
jgi:serine/threonine protein kinase